MLVGCFKRPVYEDGRLILPSDFRKLFGRGPLYATKKFHTGENSRPQPYLAIFAQRDAQRDSVRIREEIGLDEYVSPISLQKANNSSFRLYLNSVNRWFLEDPKSVVIIGMGSYIEIWPSQKYEEWLKEADRQYSDLRRQFLRDVSKSVTV